MKTIFLKRFFHRGMKCISIKFNDESFRDRELNKKLKSIEVIRYTKTFGTWYIENTQENMELLRSVFRDLVQLDESGLTKIPEVKNTIMQNENQTAASVVSTNTTTFRLIGEFGKHLEIRRYSENTIKNYLACLYQFFAFHRDINPLEITISEIRQFEYRNVTGRRVSAAYQNTLINALKGFYKYHKTPFIDIKDIDRPRRSKELPNFLSPKEIKAILAVTTNQKHRVMLSLTYACGLRSGEVLNLKPEDINAAGLHLRINKGKGRKDRMVPIPQKLIDELRAYYKYYRPKIYLFEGQVAGEKYSHRSFQSVLKMSVRKAGIKKPVTLHWLRHSYATEMMNKGVNLRFIQEILGHKSSRTTEIYTHVTTYAKVRLPNPFDDLDL